MFEKGQKVYTITDSLGDNHFVLYEAEVIGYADRPHPLVKFGGDIGEGYYPAVALFKTPKEALEDAYKDLEEDERKVAEARQDLIRIEAELKLKEKGEKK